MKIIGLNAFAQNPSACLLIDGNLIGFSHEERFNRLKCSHGLFPSHTINWLLTRHNLEISDIDVIAFSWDCNKYPWRRLASLTRTKISLSSRKYGQKNSKGSSSFYDLIDYLSLYSPKNVETKIKNELRKFGHKGRIPRIEFVDHHLTHAYQAYYHSPFDESLVLVADGHGEENCVSGYLVRKGEFNKIMNYEIPYSLGWFYGGMTAYLGFQANRDEGKLMGLAAYGESTKDENIWIDYFDEILRTTEEGYDLNPYFFKFGANNFHARFTDNLVDFITRIDKTLYPIGLGECFESDGKLQNKYLLKGYIDLAFATQTKLESALINLVRRMVSETGIKTLAYSGGVALNCKANGSILSKTPVQNIFIHPASSDDGSALGAAFNIAVQNNELERNTLLHCRYGASFTNDEIEKTIRNCGVAYSKPLDIGNRTAQLLYEDKYVGWFNGASEMGARALGSRSIIASPLNKKAKDNINQKVKYRENWRPYCPSILKKSKEAYLEETVDSQFMILSANATRYLIDSAPAVVHIDDTVRPQIVDKNILPEWAHLIEEFGSLSGHRVILNTSFNVRGEPIINSPYDAIRTFYSTGLDALAIGDYLIEKK